MFGLVAGVWGVYSGVPPVKFVKMVKKIEMVWACGWDEGVFTPSEKFENGEMVWACGWGVGLYPQ